MKAMGKYCKAYPVRSFREFPHWEEKADAVRADRKGDAVSQRLQDDDCLFLQENLVVTDGIFLDENIVFDDVSEEWREFCTNILRFEVPDFAGRQNPDAGQSAQAAGKAETSQK